MSLNTLNWSLSTASRLGFFLFIILGLVSLFWYSVNPYILFTSVGFFALAIFLIPLMIKKNSSVFSAWTFFGLSILLGSTIRGLYIGAGYPDFRTLNHYYFLNHEADYFILPSIIFLFCLFFVAIGYVFAPIKKKHSLLRLKDKTISNKRLYIFAFLALLVSLVCIVVYIKLTGGFDILNLSKKRSTIDSVDLSESHRSWQSLKTLASISMLAHLFVLTDALKNKKLWKYVFAILLFAVAAFLPFYTSTRIDIFVYLIFSLAVTYHVRKKLQWGKLIAFTIVAIFVFQTMSILRSSKDTSLVEVVSNILLDTSILDSLILNRNGLELAKTSHIINSIPDTLDLQFGQTIAVWLVAPIPRELWNSKPLISSGPIIGTKVYGNRVSGVPPGFIGDMYWNFHLFGVIFGGFFLGGLLKWVDIRFKPSPHTIPVYVFGPMQIGHLIIGVSLGYGIVTIFIRTLMAILILNYLKIPLNQKK